MKKPIKISSFLVCLFALLACQNGNTTNTDVPKDEPTEQKKPEKTDKNVIENNVDEDWDEPNDNDDDDTDVNDENEPFVDMQLSNNKGMVVKFANKGAKIDSIKYGDLKIAENGFVAGRVANRIANARFVLDGVTYNVNKNNGKHCLHGGSQGFGEINWTKTYQNAHKIVFELDSRDGDMGFPGNIHVKTTYTLTNDGTLSIEYGAKSDAKTLFNPTNHLYINLNGIDTRTYNNHSLWIDAAKYTKADNELIPTGEYTSVTGTTLDYTVKRSYVGNNDSNLILKTSKSSIVNKVAELTGDKTGITCEVSTDRVGLQLYNDSGHICLEAQDFPDAINHSEFPSIVLEANKDYYSKTSYKFTKLETKTSNLNLVHSVPNNRMPMKMEDSIVNRTAKKTLEKFNSLMTNSVDKDCVLSPASLLLCYAGISSVSKHLDDSEFGINDAEKDIATLLNTWNFNHTDKGSETKFKASVLHQQVGTKYAFDDDKRKQVASEYISTLVSTYDSYKNDANEFFKEQIGMNIKVPDVNLYSGEGTVTYGALKMKDIIYGGLLCGEKDFNYSTGLEKTKSFIFASDGSPKRTNIYKGENYYAFKTPIYKTDLLVVLPDKGVDINTINVADAYENFMENAREEYAIGYIPLFHNRSINVDVTDLINSAVDGDEDIMSGLLKNTDDNDLEIANVYQTSDFELNEFGVTGESITAGAGASGGWPGEPIELNVDRPFYAISLFNNFPIFANKVSNPGK